MTAPLAPLAVEVVARLGTTVLDVRAADRRRGYCIGEGPGAAFPVAVAGAGADGCVALVEARADGPWLVVPRGGQGELRAEGASAPLAEGAAVRLPAGSCAIVQVGPICFELRTAPAEPAPAFRPHLDAPAWLAQAASLALFGTLALLVRFAGPESAPPRWDDPELQERLIRYTASLPTPEPAAPRLHRESHPQARREGGGGPAPAVATARPEPASAPALPTYPRGQGATDMARESGVLGVAGFNEAVARFTASLAESGKHYARSLADDAAWAEAARAVPRALEMAATLRGGGGEARGVVDLPVSLLARVDASGQRRWAGHGRKESAFASGAAVAVREAPRQDLEWTSSIGHDLIRGVVRRNSPEVRRCLREGLQRDPGMPGKIEVAFTIEAGGKVRAVEVAAGSIGDAEVQRCVAAAVKAWTFPTIVAATGDVAVRYPFSIG